MRSCVADGRTDGQTDGAGYIGPAGRQGGSNKVSKHVNIKRVQAQEFEKDKNDPTTRVVQIDYAMNFTSEWQDEIQSALWHRCSVTLFTIAKYTNGFEQTGLICSDCGSKGMESSAVFLNQIYDQMGVDSDDGMKEVIWSDGPTSEFKNRFMVETLKQLSAKYNKEFTWKFSATSHGKGIVDGVGGKAKSMVREKMFAKRFQDRIVVQSPYDFYEAAKKLMRKTNVVYVSQETITKLTKEHPIKDAVEVPGITKAHIVKVDHKRVTAWVNVKAATPFIVPAEERAVEKAKVLTEPSFTKIKKSSRKKSIFSFLIICFYSVN